MPNEACNTSIFFLLSQTVNTWGLFCSANQSQLKTVRWNRDWCRPFFWGNHGDVHAGPPHSPTAQKYWIGWILLCWLKSPPSWRGNGLISLRKFVLSDQGEGRKKPSGNNQSTSVFQLVHFHLVTLFLSVGGGGWCHGGGGRLDTFATPELPQLRPCRGRRDRLLHPFTSDLCLFWPPQEATIGSDCGCQQNCERSALNCWRIQTQWRAMMYLSPPLDKVLKPFFMGSLLHLHLLYCVSPVSFYVCASFWSVFSSFVTFLFWCGLEKPCFVFGVMSSVSLSWIWVFSQSLVLIRLCLCFY